MIIPVCSACVSVYEGNQSLGDTLHSAAMKRYPLKDYKFTVLDKAVKSHRIVKCYACDIKLSHFSSSYKVQAEPIKEEITYIEEPQVPYLEYNINVGSIVKVSHPITVLNPDEYFEIKFMEVKFQRMTNNTMRTRAWIRGDNTMWFAADMIVDVKEPKGVKN